LRSHSDTVFVNTHKKIVKSFATISCRGCDKIRNNYLGGTLLC
jgi:hypothetical protein